jgi:hypothetical protein
MKFYGSHGSSETFKIFNDDTKFDTITQFDVKANWTKTASNSLTIIIQIFCIAGDNCALNKVQKMFSNMLFANLQVQYSRIFAKILNIREQSNPILG